MTFGPMRYPAPDEPCPVCGGDVERPAGYPTRIYCSARCRSRATTRRSRGLCVSDRLAGAR